MQLKTILNRVHRCKSFVYESCQWDDSAARPTLVVKIVARRNSRPICSVCDRRGGCYDHLPERRFEFIPLWGMAVFFAYRMRLVNCRACGVKVERVPWADGKSHLTTEYCWFLARWARRLSWKEVAEAFQTSWENVFRSVKYAVCWGLVARPEMRRILRHFWIANAVRNWKSLCRHRLQDAVRVRHRPLDNFALPRMKQQQAGRPQTSERLAYSIAN